MTISSICFSFYSLEAMDGSIRRTRSFVQPNLDARFGCFSCVALMIIASDSGLVEKEQSRKTRQRLSKRHQVVKESRQTEGGNNRHRGAKKRK